MLGAISIDGSAADPTSPLTIAILHPERNADADDFEVAQQVLDDPVFSTGKPLQKDSTAKEYPLHPLRAWVNGVRR